MKSTVVDESLSSTNLQFCSRENQLATIIPTELETCMSKNVLYHLENASYSNTPTLVLIVLMSQITIGLGMKILVILLLTIAPKTHCLAKWTKMWHSH